MMLLGLSPPPQTIMQQPRLRSLINGSRENLRGVLRHQSECVVTHILERSALVIARCIEGGVCDTLEDGVSFTFPSLSVS